MHLIFYIQSIPYLIYIHSVYDVMVCKINICLDIVVLSGIREKNWVDCNEQLLPQVKDNANRKRTSVLLEVTKSSILP